MQVRKNLLLGLLCALSILANAQTPASIKGHLKSASGEPIIGASIKLLNTSFGAISNETGFFIIKGVQPGSYTVSVSLIGYKTQQHNAVLTAGKDTELRIDLKEETVGMEVVTVTGRTVVQEANRQAYNVTVVDAKKLYNSTLDLAGALDRVAGIRVRESGGVGSNFNLSLNGFSGNHVRYFIDGIPMDNFGSSFQINNIPINIADRLEVYKGVVPIWLGSDALGGAINIVTGDRYKNYIDVSYSYGSFNTHRSVINAAVTSKSGLTLQLNAFQNYSDNNYRVKVDAADIYTGAYTPGAWVKRFNDTYRNETLIANVGILNKPFADKLLFGITLGQNYKDIQTGARMVTVFGKLHRKGNIIMPTLKYKKDNIIKGLDMVLNANFNLGEEQTIDTVNARFDWYGNSKPQGSSGERSRSLSKNKDNNGIVTTTLNYHLGDNQSLALSDVFTTFNRKINDPFNPPTTVNSKKTLQKNVLGVGYIYEIKDKWSATVFAKHLRQSTVNGGPGNSSSVNKLGYGIAATYFVTPNLQIKSSFEQANRLPESNEIFGDLVNLQGNPNLSPENSKNVNLGLGYSFALNSDNKFMVNASGIYRYANDFIYSKLNQNQSQLTLDNRDGVRIMGGDGEIRYSYKSWLTLGTTVTYQYLQNMQKIEPGYTGISPLYKDQMPNIPFFYGNSDASVSLKNFGKKGNNLNIGYNLLYVHAFYLYWPSLGNDKLDIPQQISHDVNLVYSVAHGRYNIGLECRNINDALLYDNFSLQKPGRAFYLNLRYFFNKTNN